MSRLLVLMTAFVMTLAIGVRAQLPEVPANEMCGKDDKRIQVMLVGSYHMSNPGLDQFNLKSDDVLAEKRQKEIKNLVNRLAKFKPTKVAVEAPFEHQPTIDRYNKYVSGERTLRNSEEEQIGFRLANQMGHKTIYPIDVKLPLDSSGLEPVIKAQPKFGKNMGDLNKFGNRAIAMMGEWLKEETVGEVLYRMNRQDFLKLAHLPYVDFISPIADKDNYAGADMVASWYKRNIRIYANLTRTTEAGDRVFIIYGQGHIPIIQALVDDSFKYCRVDPLPYLKEKKEN